jgi:catalytic LigB subunit of aromatic ring-opening dioxygenase
MPITFAAAASHAPGMTAWADAAPPDQKHNLYNGYERLRRKLESSGAEVLILLTSEHWANFFLDHIGAFCIGRGDHFTGPIEPWLRVEKAQVTGDPELATEIVDSCYECGIEPDFSYEMEFDHGTMVPLHFLTPAMDKPVVPIMFNTLAAPQPAPRRCLDLGGIIGRVARQSTRRIGKVRRVRQPGLRRSRKAPSSGETHAASSFGLSTASVIPSPYRRGQLRFRHSAVER